MAKSQLSWKPGGMQSPAESLLNTWSLEDLNQFKPYGWIFGYFGFIQLKNGLKKNFAYLWQI